MSQVYVFFYIQAYYNFIIVIIPCISFIPALVEYQP
jgi:hypothetical protein